jgi:hypothetical protein
MDRTASPAMFRLSEIKGRKSGFNEIIFQAFKECRRKYPAHKKTALYKMLAKKADISARTIQRILAAKKQLILL